MTYSIAARDAESGLLGVAVQSHFLAVGAHVPWGLAGVGVVATQATALRRYGARGLELMAGGAAAPEALTACIGADDASETRQVGLVDAMGRSAAHTGTRCWAFRAHETRGGACAQANMVASEAIPAAMLDAYEARGDFAERLLAALDAAQTLGGDLRGQQSAALLVVSGQRGERPEDGVVIDLRVDNHPAPLAQLRRTYVAHRAHTLMLPALRGPACRGAVRATDEELAGAVAAFEAAQALCGPENLEPTFWHAVALFRAGRLTASTRLLARLREENPGWGTLFAHVTDP